MIRFITALSLLLCPATALAQSGGAPLIFEPGAPVPLAGAAPPQRAMAGESFLLPLTILNRSDRAVNLRRITFRVPEGAELIDPNIDRIDNDRDGAVDEGDEGFSRVDGTASAWRIDETTDPLAAGDTLERAITLRLLDTAEAGETLSLDAIAAASAEGLTMRAERQFSFTLLPPTLSVTLDGSTEEQAWRASDTPLMRAAVTIPGGRMTALSLSMKGSPAIDGYTEPRVVLGEGVKCDAPTDPTTEGRTLTASLGICQVIAGSPQAERFVALEAKARFQDAEPFSTPTAITARRTLRLAAVMSREEAVLGDPATVSGRLTGPLIGARMLSVSDTPVDAGDPVSATWRVVNRGDEASNGLRLFLADEGAIDCLSAAMGEGLKERDACKDGLAVQRMVPGSLRDVTVTARLRDNALFDGQTVLRLAARGTNISAVTLPPAALTLRAPAAPVLSLVSEGEWDTAGEIVTTRIGDAGTVDFGGTLPEGRSPTALRLLTRLVDAQTGEPVGPAPLRVETFDVRTTDDVETDGAERDVTSATERGWSVATLPLGTVAVPVGDDKSAPGYSARATLSLRDLPEMQAGRLIEIAAQLSVFGDTEIRGEDWIEILIVEPMLDMTIRSPDVDRIIDLHETVPVAVLSCNRGTSGAEALILTVRLPDGLLLDDTDTARLRTIDAVRSDDTAALFDHGARVAGEVFHDASGGVLRGAMNDDDVLEPDTCVALVFHVRRSEIFVPDTTSATILAAVEPFTGRAGAQARIYSGVAPGEIRFGVPPLLLGPVSERSVDGDRLIAHELSLEIPAAATPHRVDLSVESSAGLDWTILRLGERGAVKPWLDGATIGAGQTARFRLEAPSPSSLPLGWIDTTLVRALAFPERGAPVAATTRIITRRSEAPGGRITMTKKMALDRDCDGELGDERIQDALFEPVKYASPGDCVVFRVVFRHTGNKSMERIVVRDRVPSGTELRPDAVEILRMPEPLQGSEIEIPGPDSRDVVWSFEGLFEPGAEGEVSYEVRLIEPPL